MENKSVVILGAGLAGLRSASVLVDRGYQVTVIERAPMAGGCTSSWTDHRDPEHGSIRKGQMQMNFPFYENLNYFCWRELTLPSIQSPITALPKSWTNQPNPSFTGRLDGFFLADEGGRRMHLTGKPSTRIGKALSFLPAPLSNLQILTDFEGFPTLRDRLSAVRFHALALLFGDKSVPPISDDWNFYGIMKHLGLTHEAVKTFRRITYSITNLADADQVGPKFMHLFYLAYLRDKNILGCRMMNDDCNPALIDRLVETLKARGVNFRFNCHVRDILTEQKHAIGVTVEDCGHYANMVCDNCGLLYPPAKQYPLCPACGCATPEKKYRKNMAKPTPELIEAEFIISAMQPHQLANLFRSPDNHPLREFREFRALGQFKGAALTVSRIFLDRKVTHEYNLTGLDRDFWSMNGCMDISNIMPRYEKTSVFDTLSDDGEVLEFYPEKVLKARLLTDVKALFPEVNSAKVHKHLLARIYPAALYHRPFPRLNSRFLPHSPATSLANLFLAGDWTDEFELGMEAAVKSGTRAANAVLEADNRINLQEPIYRPTVAPLTAWLQSNFLSRQIKKWYQKRYDKERAPSRG
ncbi:MAG: FAD-dependent oxidoreductase [bacterium]|nr:FAD-dependent oxidoreductase [bacterium]